VPAEGACSPTSATDRARRFEGHQVCHFQVRHLARSDHRGVIENKQPAATIRYLGQGKFADSDPGGESAVFDTLDAPDKLPRNYQLVIYELPTAWALSRSVNAPERAIATFLDVAALIDERIGGANFGDLSMLESGKAYLADLGSNRWSCSRRPKVSSSGSGGNDTSHYLAPPDC